MPEEEYIMHSEDNLLSLFDLVLPRIGIAEAVIGVCIRHDLPVTHLQAGEAFPDTGNEKTDSEVVRYYRLHAVRPATGITVEEATEGIFDITFDSSFE